MSSLFRERKLLNPLSLSSPLSLFLNNRCMIDVLIYHDCNASWGLIIRYGLFTSWKFGFDFDLWLHDLHLHVPELFQFAL